jgi:hypothetical protein
MSRQWYGVAVEKPTPFRILRHYPGLGENTRHASRDGSIRDALITVVAAERQKAPNWVVAETLEEFRWGACAVRDLHAAWICLSDGSDPREVDWANQLMPGPGKDAAICQANVAEFFERTMRDALEGFSPRMWLVNPDKEHARYGAVSAPQPVDVTLFEALALELFSHVAEHASYKRCANPMCSKTFVRQDGGAAHRQSRMTGVLYCSRTCANSVAQRRHRQKRARRIEQGRAETHA